MATEAILSKASSSVDLLTFFSKVTENIGKSSKPEKLLLDSLFSACKYRMALRLQS